MRLETIMSRAVMVAGNMSRSLRTSFRKGKRARCWAFLIVAVYEPLGQENSQRNPRGLPIDGFDAKLLYF